MTSSIERADISYVKEKGIKEKFVKYTMNLFFVFECMSWKREDRMDIDIKRKSGDKEYHTTNQLKKKYKRERKISKESITDSFDIKNSVFDWLKMVEPKTFVDDGMLLRMKIIPIIWPFKNIIITRVIGGFIQKTKF